MDATATIPANLRGALEEAKTRLQSEFGPRLRALILYGSRARGDAELDSDVDLIALMEGELQPGDARRCIDAIYPVILESELLLHVHPVSTATYEAQEYLFYRNVRREGIVL